MRDDDIGDIILSRVLERRNNRYAEDYDAGLIPEIDPGPDELEAAFLSWRAREIASGSLLFAETSAGERSDERGHLFERADDPDAFRDPHADEFRWAS